jgi:hypothetical protein
MSGPNPGLSPAQDEFARVKREIVAEFPDFRFVRKMESRLMKVIDLVLRVITFGMMRKFLTSYTTTIGTTVYVTPGWDNEHPLMKAALLRHERVHMRQRDRLGPIIYSLKYLMWPLPAVFAIGRRQLEQEAYAETLRAYHEYYGDFVLLDRNIRRRIVGEFVGPAYFWTWPFRKDIERWYDDVLASLGKAPTED